MPCRQKHCSRLFRASKNLRGPYRVAVSAANPNSCGTSQAQRLLIAYELASAPLPFCFWWDV
jgi:hypothetical protein